MVGIGTYDVIVIGAGPAGSAAARRTAQFGLKTLLLEKEKMPRNKLCGGAVTPKVLRLLDFQLSEDVIESAPRAARLHVGNATFKFHSEVPLVYMTSREKFDMALATKAAEAGAEVRDGTVVQSVMIHASCAEVHTRDGVLEAKGIIGCDGTGGPTARATQLYQSWKAPEVSYGIESEVPVGTQAVREFMGAEEFFDIYFGVSPAGYGWIFPKDDHLTIGVGCRLSKLRDAQQLLRSFIQIIPELKGRRIPPPRAHLVPLGGIAETPAVGDRVLLAGDSAGFVEPLLGEGIYFAIWAGQIAAEVLGKANRTGRFDFESLNAYKKRCDEAFGKDFSAAYQLAKASYLENYDMDRIGRFFFSNTIFQKSMVRVLDGSMRYRDVQRKLSWLYFKYRLSKLGLPVKA